MADAGSATGPRARVNITKAEATSLLQPTDRLLARGLAPFTIPQLGDQGGKAQQALSTHMPSSPNRRLLSSFHLR